MPPMFLGLCGMSASDDLRFVFELLEDVLAIGYSTLADLDREEVEP